MGNREAPSFPELRRPGAAPALRSSGAPRGVAPGSRMTATMPAPPFDRPDRRSALRRLVLLTVLAVVVAGIAVPATTKVGFPAKVAQATKTHPPAVDGLPPP